jgi:hypothetical protein
MKAHSTLREVPPPEYVKHLLTNTYTGNITYVITLPSGEKWDWTEDVYGIWEDADGAYISRRDGSSRLTKEQAAQRWGEWRTEWQEIGERFDGPYRDGWQTKIIAQLLAYRQANGYVACTENADLLYHHNALVRCGMAGLLGELKDPDGVETLAIAMATDESIGVRKECAKSLGKIGDPSAIRALLAALQDDAVKGVAADALHEIEQHMISTTPSKGVE